MGKQPVWKINRDIVEEIIEDKGLLRTEIVDMLEINLSTFWRHLNGHGSPSYMFVAALAQILGTTVSEIANLRTATGDACPRCHYCRPEELSA